MQLERFIWFLKTKAINLGVWGRAPILNYADLLRTSENKIFSWLTTKSQLSYLLVHLLEIFSVAKYSIFNKLSSLGNINLVFVTFLNWLFKLSMQFVVYMIFLIKSGNIKNVDKLSQLLSQVATAFGYFKPHFFFKFQ